MSTATVAFQRDISIAGSFNWGTATSSSLGTVDEGLYLARIGELDYTDESLLSDDATTITATYMTRDIDCSDVDVSYKDKFKTLVKVRLEYVDMITDMSVTVSASVDGGYTWVSKTRTIGAATGKTKIADFVFLDQTGTTGKIFTFKITNVSTDAKFQWLGLDVFFSPRGDFFEVS